MTKYKKLKPSCAFAVLLVFLAEVLAEAVFFGEDLDEHDGEEKHPDKQSLPSPEPNDKTGEVSERAGEHRITVEAVGTVGHEVLGAWADFLAESVHRIAFSVRFHIDDGPDAEAQTAEDEDAGERGAERADVYCQIRRAGYQPHDGRQKKNKHHAAEDVTCYFTHFFHNERKGTTNF